MTLCPSTLHRRVRKQWRRPQRLQLQQERQGRAQFLLRENGLRLRAIALQKLTEPVTSELHEYGQVDPVLNFLKVRCESVYEGARGSANIFNNRRCGAGRRCNASRPREVRNIRSAMVELPTKSNVLAWHVIECCRSIPGFEGIAGVLGEIWRAGGSRRSVDRGQQHQIA